MRTRYECIIPELEAVFPAEDIHYDFYEKFISQESVRSLCDFLGITFVPPDISHRVNVSFSETRPTPEAIRQVRLYYDETYAYCAARFGEDLIGKIWPNF